MLIEMDVRDETPILRGIQTIIEQDKRIDVLVNSAGVTLLGATEETSITEAQTLFDTNLFGLLRTTKAVLPQYARTAIRPHRQCRLGAGLYAGPHIALYAASKHAVEGLSETLDHEVRQFGIIA